MLPSESKYFGMAKGVLDRFQADLECRYQAYGRFPTDAMLLSYARLCLDVAFAEAGFVPERFAGFLPVLVSRSSSSAVDLGGAVDPPEGGV